MGSTFTGTAVTQEIVDWIKAEFYPRILAIPDGTIYQQIDNAIEYFNCHSAYRIAAMVDYPNRTARVQLDEHFKNVARVFPAENVAWILNDHPMWTLLGITILDNITTDLIMTAEAFKNYRQYVGTNFQWHFERSDDPSVGGYLYCVNNPSGVSRLCVVGTRRIIDYSDIVDEYISYWIKYYAKSLVKQIEGHALRAASIVEARSDGQELLNEGKEEAAELKDRLSKDARWFAFVRRA